MTLWHKVVAALTVALAVVAAGCGDSGDGNANSSTNASESKEVVLVTHDSFAIPKQVKAAFEQESGLKLTILQGGDAGEMVNRALLTKGNPQGDVLFGIDNNLLSRALDEGLFEPYIADGLEFVDAAYRIDPTHAVTPIDHGDVCLNVDRKWFASHGVAPPQTLADLTAAALQEPARRREPRHLDARAGVHARHDREVRRERLAGLLARSCGRTACSPSTAGRRRTPPSSPAPAAARATGRSSSPTRRARRPRSSSRRRRRRPPRRPSSTDSCFRQIELAGVLDGAKNPNGARAFIDFMLSEQFQAAMPESMFVLPVREGRRCPRRSRSTPSRRRARSSCPRRRSAATAIAGSTSGHRSSCAEARRAARHDRRPGGVPRALLRLPTRRDPRAWADVHGRSLAPRRARPACCGSRSGRR